MAGEYQFSLVDVTKQQGTKTILKDVNLSFFYGAHIGVIGGNGAGKSSLLKILAGLDTDLIGTVQVAKGTKVGYLPQEPELDDSKTVGECVEEAIALRGPLLQPRRPEGGGRDGAPAGGDRREGPLERGEPDGARDGVDALSRQGRGR